MQFSLHKFAVITVYFSALFAKGVAQVAGSHTSLNRWCGKPYQSGSPNYNPGGQTQPPPVSSCQLLYLQVQPRYNIYVDTESFASFLVSASLSRSHGQPYEPTCAADETFLVIIALKGTGQILVKKAPLKANDKQKEFDFATNILEARMKAYIIVATIVSESGKYHFTATTELFFLPDKTTGSVTKVDNLYGGLLFKNRASNYQFEPVLGVGFYTDYGGYLAQNSSALKEYYDAGFRTIHPIAGYEQPSSPPYNPLTLDQVWDEADALNLLWIYDMRGIFMNLTEVEIEVMQHKDRETLYMWYTADEPDGWEYALNSTKLAYDAIRSIDMYHPVSLVLNCFDFFFKQYTAGADIIMEDAYPIAINATYSYTWGIPCNSTYGDCGCDDCNGVIQDVSDRLDALASYQSYLGQPAKPLYAVPQAFSDPEYWPRIPTQEEVWSMNGIALNHNAKSIYSWTFPTDDSLVTAHSLYARIVTVEPVMGFLIGANSKTVSVARYPKLDVAYWIVGNQALVSFVNGYNSTLTGLISVALPFKAYTFESQPWGEMEWSLEGNSLQVEGATALQHSIVILNI